MNISRYVVIHCSDISYRKEFDQFNNINSYHKNRGFPKSSLGIFVGYHALITGDKVYNCKEDTDVGAHCNQGYDGSKVYPAGSGLALSMNYQSLGVCVGFDGDIEMPTAKQYELLQAQVWAWQDRYLIPNERVFFHRKFATGKTCPGSLITVQWLKDLLTRPKPIIEEKDRQCVDIEPLIEKKKRWYNNLMSFIRSQQ